MKKTSFVFWILASFFLVGFLTGCATSYKKIKIQDEDFIGKPLSIVNNVPFIEQEPKLCGPSALYMVSKSHRPELTLEEVTKLTYTPAASGAFKQDMLAGARRLGLAPYKVVGLSNVFNHLANQTPVLIFHRTNFLWKDFWHYSVVTGYDRKEETFFLHIGPYASHESSMSDVVGSWEEGGKWAYIVVPPSQLPQTATVEEALENSLAFLRLENGSAAHALADLISKRWPDRFEADVILAETYLKKNDLRKALKYLKLASHKQPDNRLLKRKIIEVSKTL